MCRKIIGVRLGKDCGGNGQTATSQAGTTHAPGKIGKVGADTASLAISMFAMSAELNAFRESGKIRQEYCLSL
jgi:hypothetical protein